MTSLYLFSLGSIFKCSVAVFLLLYLLGSLISSGVGRSNMSYNISIATSFRGLTKSVNLHFNWLWCHFCPCTMYVIFSIHFFITPSSQNSFPHGYIFKNTLSPGLKYLFILFWFLDVLTFHSGSNLLNTDLIFLANISYASNIPGTVFRFGVILKMLRNCCNITSSASSPSDILVPF